MKFGSVYRLRISGMAKAGACGLAMLLMAAAPAKVQSAVLAGYYDFEASLLAEDADATVTPLLTATVTKGTESRTAGGSNDNLYGNSTLTSSPSTSGDGFLRVTDTVVFTITNNTTQSYQLDTFLFDATVATSSTGFGLAYSLNGGTAVVLTPTRVMPSTTAVENTVTTAYDDFSYALGGITLAAGQNIVFTFDSSSLRMDNIALIGNVVPEPGRMAMLGLAVRRRR